METNKTIPISLEETKKYLEDFTSLFLKLFIMSVSADMKKHGIASITDYIGIIPIQYYFEKQRAQNSSFRSTPSIYKSKLFKTKTKSKLLWRL